MNSDEIILFLLFLIVIHLLSELVKPKLKVFKMFRKKIFAVLILIIVSLLCSCLEDTQPPRLEDTQPPLKHTITKGKHTTKVKIYHSKGDILNDVVIESEDNHVKVLYQGASLTIPVPKKPYYGSVENIYFGDTAMKVSEKSGKKIQYIILTLEY